MLGAHKKTARKGGYRCCVISCFSFFVLFSFVYIVRHGITFH